MITICRTVANTNHREDNDKSAMTEHQHKGYGQTPTEIKDKRIPWKTAVDNDRELDKLQYTGRQL